MDTNTTIPGRVLEHPPMLRGPVRYRNHFRWRVMPPDEAVKQGWLDKAFENKAKALNYQKEVKRRFPNQPCCFLDTGRWYDSMGRIIH